MTTTMCAICGTRTEQPDTDAWSLARLSEPVEIRSTIDTDADSITIPAGCYRLCPPCGAWQPDARSAPLPAEVQRLIDAQVDLLVTVIDNEDARHPLVAQQVGIYRHIAQHFETVSP
jgi:hypothetical protein